MLAAVPQTPAALHAAIVASAKAQQSVHYVSSSHASQTDVTIVADAGREQGIQHITFHRGATTGHATVIVGSKAAYLRGDAFTLQNFIGFKASPARAYANVWIAVPPTHAAYGPIAAAVTLASAIDELGPKGTLTKVSGKGTVGVRSVTRLKSGGSVTDTLWAGAAKPYLPVQEVVSRPGFHATNTFSKWNEKVVVSIPKKPVPIATVLKGGGGPAA